MTDFSLSHDKNLCIRRHFLRIDTPNRNSISSSIQKLSKSFLFPIKDKICLIWHKPKLTLVNNPIGREYITIKPIKHFAYNMWAIGLIKDDLFLLELNRLDISTNTIWHKIIYCFKIVAIFVEYKIGTCHAN